MTLDNEPHGSPILDCVFNLVSWAVRSSKDVKHCQNRTVLGVKIKAALLPCQLHPCHCPQSQITGSQFLLVSDQHIIIVLPSIF